MSVRKAISLYSGAGGLDLGFEAAGFTIAVALELDRDFRGDAASEPQSADHQSRHPPGHLERYPQVGRTSGWRGGRAHWPPSLPAVLEGRVLGELPDAASRRPERGIQGPRQARRALARSRTDLPRLQPLRQHRPGAVRGHRSRRVSAFRVPNRHLQELLPRRTARRDLPPPHSARTVWSRRSVPPTSRYLTAPGRRVVRAVLSSSLAFSSPLHSPELLQHENIN
jgi:hypothetical protein